MSQEPNALVPLTRNVQPSSFAQLLSFELGATHYALPLGCVRGVLMLPSWTEVPRSPKHVLGVSAVRGQVVTLVDLRRLLGLGPAPVLPKARALLVAHGDEALALVVDAVLRVERVHPGEIEPSSVLGDAAPGYLAGIARPGRRTTTSLRGMSVPEQPDEILLLLDPASLLRAC